MTRNQQALTVLGKYLQASGGTQALEALEDYTGSGSIVYNWASKQVSGTVTLKSRGTAQFRMDSTTPDGNESWIVDHASGVMVTLNGRRLPQAAFNLLNAGDFSFPAVRIATEANDATVAVTYLGQTTVNGRAAYEVGLAPAPSGGLKWLSKLTDPGAIGLFIDAANFELLEEDETLHGYADRRQTVVEQLDFANYEPTGGLLVPFSISEKLGGQTLWSISLESISFNTGLSDSDFATGLPKPGSAR